MAKGMCFCRECQHVSGAGPVVIMTVAETSFTYTRGAPRIFARPDLEAPVAREFCADCGTHLVSRSPRMPGAALVKVGTLDDPSIYGMPYVAIYTGEKQCFHVAPAGVRSFEGRPLRPRSSDGALS